MNKLERKLTRLRNNIILHSQRIVNNKDNYVILDTETTGLKKNDVILQLGSPKSIATRNIWIKL